jgi:hypothetical protein
VNWWSKTWSWQEQLEWREFYTTLFASISLCFSFVAVILFCIQSLTTNIIHKGNYSIYIFKAQTFFLGFVYSHDLYSRGLCKYICLYVTHKLTVFLSYYNIYFCIFGIIKWVSFYTSILYLFSLLLEYIECPA